MTCHSVNKLALPPHLLVVYVVHAVTQGACVAYHFLPFIMLAQQHFDRKSNVQLRTNVALSSSGFCFSGSPKSNIS